MKIKDLKPGVHYLSNNTPRWPNENYRTGTRVEVRFNEDGTITRYTKSSWGMERFWSSPTGVYVKVNVLTPEGDLSYHTHVTVASIRGEWAVARALEVEATTARRQAEAEDYDRRADARAAAKTAQERLATMNLTTRTVGGSRLDVDPAELLSWLKAQGVDVPYGE